jgi:ribosomal protein S18 acetylase RimI-like enzyme
MLTTQEMISIRPVNPNEAKELTRIALASKRHWGYPERWIEIWTPQLTFNAAYFEANESWLAELNGQPVAFYTLFDQNGIAWLDNLWVAPEYMDQGIGRMLFLHVVELSSQRGYKVLQLEADPNAVGFYEKMGMHKIGERHSTVDGQPRNLPLMEMNL